MRRMPGTIPAEIVHGTDWGVREADFGPESEGRKKVMISGA